MIRWTRWLALPVILMAGLAWTQATEAGWGPPGVPYGWYADGPYSSDYPGYLGGPAVYTPPSGPYGFYTYGFYTPYYRYYYGFAPDPTYYGPYAYWNWNWNYAW
jgi:hypothetical protein